MPHTALSPLTAIQINGEKRFLLRRQAGLNLRHIAWQRLAASAQCLEYSAIYNDSTGLMVFNSLLLWYLNYFICTSFNG